MADSFGLKIGLEGEKEFKSALSDINNSFKVLKSEMNLVSSEFDKNDKSVEALTARNTVLGKEIDAQKQKIETLRSALANAAESFGENDRRTQNWQIQLNNAEAALNAMEREVESNNKAIEQADGSMDDASKSAGELADSVGDAGSEANDASSKFEVLGNVCKAVGVAMAAAFTAVAAASVAAGKALVDMTINGAAYADTVLTESTVTGIATDKLQGYMYADELVDVSTDTLTKSMAKQIKSMKPSYAFTNLIVCEKCGKSYRRKVVAKGAVWICSTYNTKGKAASPSKQIPECKLEELTEDIDLSTVSMMIAGDNNTEKERSSSNGQIPSGCSSAH